MRQILVIYFFLFLLSGCENQPTIETKSYPLLETRVTKNNSDGVLFGGRFLSRGFSEIKEAGFLFSKTKVTWYKIDVKDFSDEFDYFLNTDIEAGVRYYVKAYAVSDNFVSYGNIVYFESQGFNSLAPVVEGFSPADVSDGYTAFIYGKNFSFLEEKVSVVFNGINSNLIYLTHDTICYKVPVLPAAGDYMPILKVNDKEVSFGPVTVKNPVVYDFSPRSGFDGAIITVRGDFFALNPRVFFGMVPGSKISYNDSIIIVRSPSTSFFGYVTLMVDVTGKSSIENKSYEILKQVISGISNMSGTVGSKLEIYGSYFVQDGRISTVYFNNSKAIVSSCLSDTIKVFVPNFTGTEAVIKVINGAKETSFAGFIKTSSLE